MFKNSVFGPNSGMDEEVFLITVLVENFGLFPLSSSAFLEVPGLEYVFS